MSNYVKFKGDKMSITCYEMLLKGCDLQKGSILFNKHKLTMAKFIKDIDTLADSLHNMGFKKGDVLTIYLPTCPQSLEAFYACSKLGIVANIVHPLLPIEKLKENLEATKSKGLMYYDILVKNHKVLNSLNQILINCSVSNYLVFRKLFYYLFARSKYKTNQESIHYSKLIKRNKFYDELGVEGKGYNIACTMHSGGTSGQPKIIKLSNRALNNLSTSLEKMYTRKERNHEYGLVALPMFHAYGLGVAVHTCLTNGYSLILMPKFQPKKMNNYVKYHNVTFIAGVPIMFRKMLSYKNFYGKHLRKLRDLWCGGDILNETFVEHIDTILEKYNSPARLMRGYGLTEVSSVCAVNTLNNYKKNSCGKPIPNTKIEIWDDNEEKLKNNTIGEIVIESPSMMTGYLDKENGQGFVVKNKKKYIKTGDLGYLDEDGFLFVVDRKKRSIKISAVNVFPSEIENTVKELPYIEEVCAVPYHYNEKTYIRLYVSTNNSQLNKNKVHKEILEHCQKKLIKYSIPREIVILDNLPRTNMGKIDYKTLQNIGSYDDK